MALNHSFTSWWRLQSPLRRFVETAIAFHTYRLWSFVVESTRSTNFAE